MTEHDTLAADCQSAPEQGTSADHRPKRIWPTPSSPAAPSTVVSVTEPFAHAAMMVPPAARMGRISRGRPSQRPADAAFP